MFCLLLIDFLFLKDVKAQMIANGHVHQENPHDPDFPGRQRFNTGLMATYTGITPPPAVIGDVTYGISRKLSVGFLAGTTGAQSLAGVKLNATLFNRNNFRVIYRMVVIYYPGRDGEYLFDKSDKFIMPWMLSLGAVDAE